MKILNNAHQLELSNQLTITCVFDNWQRLIQKLWQDMGKSSIFQRGTAFFFKQDKSFILPVGTIMRSPSGLMFRVVSCIAIDIYTSMVHGELVPCFPMNRSDSTMYDDILAKIRIITSDGFMWPRIGWAVLEIPGLDKCQSIQYGVDQYIPAPLGARVAKDVSSNNLLLRDRVFSDVTDDNSRIISTTEAHDLFVRFQRLNELQYFADYLKGYYNFKDEVAMQMEEEGQSSAVTEVDTNLVPLVRSQENDESFMNTMEYCSLQLDRVRTFERDILDQVNPGRKVQDKFYFHPLCPREETSTNGMLLTSATLNEKLGFLNKLDDGEFGLDINALKRRATMYGDALSCITHGNSKLVIAKKGTVPGNEKLVDDLLGAHSRIVMQKGLFHQLMHQSAVVYIKYYGSFMQAMQVLLSVKRVKGDPVKSNYQDHDKFQLKLYRACRRFRFAKFIGSLSASDLDKDRQVHNMHST